MEVNLFFGFPILKGFQISGICGWPGGYITHTGDQ